MNPERGGLSVKAALLKYSSERDRLELAAADVVASREKSAISAALRGRLILSAMTDRLHAVKRDFVLKRMLREFVKLVERGDLAIEGFVEPLSPDSQPQKLEPELVRRGLVHFDVDSSSAVVGTSTRLSGLRVYEAQPKPSAQITTAAAEDRCRNWLVGHMRAGPATQPKAAYRKLALSQFNVGTKAFDRAWAAALRESGNRDWSKPGRRKS